MSKYPVIIKQAQKWMNDESNKERLYTRPLNTILDSLNQKTDKFQIDIAGSFRWMGFYHQMAGTVQIAAGNPEGWKELYRGLFYHYWMCKIFAKSWEIYGRRKGNLASPINVYILVLLRALFMGKETQVAWITPWFERELDGYFKTDDDYIERGIPGFALTLGQHFLHRSNQPVIKPYLILGIYSQIFENWENIGELKKAILGACDFHVKRQISSSYDIGEFVSTPDAVLPLEYLALCRVRRAQGLDTPKPSHPLLDTPFANPPDSIPPYEDELLDRALASVREVIPDL